ncbi:SurA N-terminal domain-containing protein [Jannaschia seohaensis]|uniref:Parvulin-like PPIase n=1 Tax=Jannaschia seohaensis TaxID=475081 RepID=A0A2Y9AQC2_9RHOB|nr:SurA N-terminal domain-containing protein [Jannaschia seohaensis]PWJ18051.1 peptidyl-prolyl cis-trans isomerase D [Jannaschia seohaensis]SSA46574.1 peptidyl-prolyl cis-trans isomerase D [Jannaschia seohaensis]
MADEERRPKKKGNLVVWAILGLLILALGGFGVGQFGGNLTSVATVGEREITVQDYANAIRQEQNRLQQQTGQRLTMQQMQQFGLDQQVMERLLALAALEEEARRMGLSVGDAEVAERIRSNPAFGGISGEFDREGYSFALRSIGMNERRFEERIRAEAGAELLQAAVVGGIGVRDAHSQTIVDWLAETRTVTFAELGRGALDGISRAPTEEELAAFYEENGAAFEIPETRQITYAWVTPSMILDEVDIPEDRIAQRYEELGSEFRQPERVLAERLIFRDQAAAEAALAALEAGETDFDTLVEDRGLTLDDVDIGDVSRDDLDPAVAEALFALEEPGIAGPLETGLGPALFRVNAILDATEVPLEEVRDEIRDALARDAARREIDMSRESIDDLLAGGATLEELAQETSMELGTVALRPGASGGIVDYEAFRSAALAVAEGDFPELGDLADGGLFALRLEAIEPPQRPALEDVRAAVEQAWRDDDDARRLAEAAEAVATRLEAGESFEEVGLTPETLENISRDGVIEGLPRALVAELFEAEEGAVLARRGNRETAFVLRIDAVAAPDPEDPQTADLIAAVEQQIRSQVASDLFASFAEAVRADIGFTVDQQAVQAVQTQLLGGG